MGGTTIPLGHCTLEVQPDRRPDAARRRIPDLIEHTFEVTILWEPVSFEEILDEIRARQWAAFLMRLFRNRHGAVLATLLRPAETN